MDRNWRKATGQSLNDRELEDQIFESRQETLMSPTLSSFCVNSSNGEENQRRFSGDDENEKQMRHPEKGPSERLSIQP